MKQKITIELDDKLKDGELLIYKDGIVKSVDVHDLLLKELKKINENSEDIKKLKNKTDDLSDKVKELRGED